MTDLPAPVLRDADATRQRVEPNAAAQAIIALVSMVALGELAKLDSVPSLTRHAPHSGTFGTVSKRPYV